MEQNLTQKEFAFQIPEHAAGRPKQKAKDGSESRLLPFGMLL
jgi:hypothetical protein